MKAEVLAARADRLRKVLRLGRRHHKDHVVGRLFERLQQGIECGIGNLMGFVEDVNFVAVAGRPVTGRIAQLADFVDAAVRGGVNFNHIDGISGANLCTGYAGAARLGGGAFGRADLQMAVERHGQNAGNSGFADAAMPAEDVPMRNAALAERIHQRAGDVILSGDIRESLGAVFPCKYLICHRSISIAATSAESMIVPPATARWPARPVEYLRQFR